MNFPPDYLIQAQAPGKFIISGEYSVIFGKPAIAAAIDAKTTVTVQPCSKNSVVLKLNDLNYQVEWNLEVLENARLVVEPARILNFQDEMIGLIDRNILKHSIINNQDNNANACQLMESNGKIRDSSVAFLLIYLGIGDCFDSSIRQPMEVMVESDLPVGSGLGSSSAYSVSIIGALNKVYNCPLDLAAICQWAFNIDKYFHGKPSGVDNSVITYGGYILFQAGKVVAQAKQNPAIQVMLIDTKVSRSTKTMANKLKIERGLDSRRTDKIFEDISEVTAKIWCSMTKTNNLDYEPRDIDGLLLANHLLLEELGVGHEKLTHIKNLAKNRGFTAKLSGAGCGGGAFILFNSERELNDIEILYDELEKAGYAVRLCPVGCTGLSVVNMRQ